MSAALRRMGLRLLAMGMVAACTAAGAAGEPILVGQSAVLTGPFTPNSLAFMEGQTLFFDQLNKTGGIGGRPVKMIIYDDAYIAEKAAANAEKLLGTDHVVCLFGTMGTGIGAAMLPVAAKYDSFIFGGLTGAAVLRGPKVPIYHVRESYADEVTRVMNHLTTIGVTRIAIVSSDDAYGKGIEKDALAALEKNKHPALLSLRFDPKEKDHAAIAQQVIASGAQAVYVIAAGMPAINIIRSLVAAPVHPQIYTNSVASSFLLYKELGDKSRGIVLSQVVPPFWKTRFPIVDEYQRALKGTGSGSEGSYLGLEGYITAKAFGESLQRVKGPITTESLRRSIENSPPMNLNGFTVAFRPDNRNGSSFGDITMLGSAGKFAQ
ncbi:ABC transporter substrate-binding protein [Variovorax sp. PAMC26660]|uniref:ABC transporter substrate-binding protein n=1 Tax=Variovorax sp. PAMC26660 TaxID=2762322 RepID=UPI00164CE5F2|nr:ABC transporter substrate-binding protein [Variovorax sp. PAMC26660]QNK65709.1 ABC transporter substrate-binding protein [Variovorax sp. PAMC26660]